MEFIWQIALNTPWWVYLLLVVLVKIGIRASKTSIVSFKKLFLMPVIFSFMSVHTLMTSFKVDFFAVSVWGIAIFLGVLLGWFQVFRRDLKVDKKHFLFQIPGSWSTLIIIIIIFASKYYFGYELAVDPQLVDSNWFEIAMLAVSGVCTGLFIGRLFCYIYRMLTSTSVDLVKMNAS